MTETAVAADFEPAVPLPPIPGLRFRHFAGSTDYAGMNDAANDARIANGDHFITPLEGFANFYEHLVNSDRDRDLLIVEVHGEIVGYARTEWHAHADGNRIHQLVCFLRSAWRRRGIGRAMLSAMEARAAAVSASLDGSMPSLYESNVEEADRGAVVLLEDSGYAPVRHGYTMVRPNLDPVTDARMPEGLEIRQVRDEHLRAIFEAGEEAARDMWDYWPATDEDYQLFLTDPIQGDRTLWRIAWDGDQVAGQVRGFINAEENERFGQKRGWVENILVRRPWRKRGLARALMASTIDALRERGMTEAALGVDAENPSGALRLYESVGFRPESHAITFRKPVPDRAG
ncbi:MAG TPA: GNAT family N-acetyltransferase [Candidatus Limnocylindrales bacterium]|nr:GNAT family N-acetyltransferase [Candidatus Limnocylindrales bacterium]